MERAVAYVRVSDPRRAEDGNSLATQERIAAEYAKSRNYECRRVFVERGESAKTDERPALQDMLVYLRKERGRVDVVNVPKIDRLARNVHDYATMKVQLARLGVRLESVGERIEDTPVGRFTESVLASVAQFDNKIRAKRCRGGMVQAAREGRWVWRAPTGYPNVRHEGRGTIEPDPRTAPLVKEAFLRVASGLHSVKEVREWLEVKGLPMTLASVHRLLRNRAYLGVIESFGQSFPAAPPFVPIVERSAFLLVQGAPKVNGKPQKPFERDNPDYPLRGALRCECGRFLTAGWSHNAHKRYDYYRCLVCRNVNHRREAVEAAFESLLVRLQPRAGTIPRIMSVLRETWNDTRQEVRESLQRVAEEIRSLEELQGALAIKNASGIVPDRIAKAQIEELAARIAELERQQASLERDAPSEAGLLEFGLTLLVDLGQKWRRASLKNRKRLQSFLYPMGLVYTKNGKIRTSDYPLLERLDTLLEGLVSPMVETLLFRTFLGSRTRKKHRSTNNSCSPLQKL
jgi:DNA invertase Pin-like site-specific DNA recombinase